MRLTQRRRGHRRTPRVQRRLVTLVLLLATAASWPTSTALADGDPASDVLASQTLFLPQDAGLPTAQQAQLGALLATANRGGYPIRVAIIAAPTDLGSVNALWRQPENYARFLGQELSLVYRGPLLVVMPNGFGVLNASPSHRTRRNPIRRPKSEPRPSPRSSDSPQPPAISWHSHRPRPPPTPAPLTRSRGSCSEPGPRACTPDHYARAADRSAPL